MYVLIVLLSFSFVADDPTDAAGYLRRGQERQRKRQYADAVKDFTEGLRLDPARVEALDGRGSCHFMLGKFKESVADFDRQIKLDPRLADGHWRRGISLYYAGQYDEGRKQFEGYEKVDTTDVENAVWHIMCVAKKDGLKAARKGVLKIAGDKRIPMMQVYELYKGTITPDDVMKATKEGKPGDDEMKSRLFYAHLYLGIYHDLLGENKKASEHLALAAGKYKIGHYMGEVARIALTEVSKSSRSSLTPPTIRK